MAADGDTYIVSDQRDTPSPGREGVAGPAAKFTADGRFVAKLARGVAKALAGER